MQDSQAAIQIFGRAVPYTKENQKATAIALANKVTNGELDPITTFATVKAMSDCLSQFLKDKSVMETTVAAVERYGRAGANFNGANLCIAEVGVKYDFSVCDDPEWNELSKQKADIEAKLKARETFLRGIPRRATIINEESGEISTVYPPGKSSTTAVKVTFAK